jgi:tripartite ATP-independent transporter DctM subunit
MFFAGISGSAVADTAAMGSILIPAMKKEGYSLEFSSAVTASSSVIGPIIPPSIPVVIFAMVGSVSVGGLFLAGFMPGVMIGLGLMIVSYVQARRFGYGIQRQRASFKELVDSTREALIPLFMPIIILGGILSGIFTATEASAVAVAYAILIGFFVLKKLTLKALPEIFFKSMVTTSTILLVMACANIFSWILSTQQIPQTLVSSIASITDDPLILLLLINLILFVVGCFLEGIAAIVIMVPILLPLALHAGIDPIHFGIVVIMNLMIGLITPPLGLCLFVVCSVADVNFIKLVRATLPFLAIEIVALMFVTYLPEIALFIPHFFGFR